MPVLQNAPGVGEPHCWKTSLINQRQCLLPDPWESNALVFKTMVARQEESLLFPTLYPATGFAPGKSKHLLVLMGSLKGAGFSLDRGSHWLQIQNEKQTSALTMQSGPLPTHLLEVRIHLRTKLWSLARTSMSLVCVLLQESLCHLLPSFWPQTVWRQEALFNPTPRQLLVVSNTTTERLGNLHPRAKEPTVSFHTHRGYVIYILYFALFLDVAGQVMHMPSGEFEILFDRQHGTGSQPLCVLSRVPQMGFPFPEHSCSAPARRQSPQEVGSVGVPEPSGGAGPALLSVKQTENKGGEGWGQDLQLENGRKERIGFPIVLISQGHHKLD